MLKASSKKKRSRVEMEEVKQEEDELNDDKHSFLRQYKKLKNEHEMLKVEKTLTARTLTSSTISMSKA